MLFCAIMQWRQVFAFNWCGSQRFETRYYLNLISENLLLDETNRILKITDFGVSTVFKNPFCSIREKLKGVTGSGPYIAPEEFIQDEYDSEAVDIWSIGIIGYILILNFQICYDQYFDSLEVCSSDRYQI